MTRHLPRIGLTALCPLALAVVLCACSGDDSCTPGEFNTNGPRCCAGGCGMGTDGWHLQICNDEGEWECIKKGSVLEDDCASPYNACNTMTGCYEVGIGKEEADPAPELCCQPGCDGKVVKHRVCKDGIKWECPGGTVPISRCKDPKSACNGILGKYNPPDWKVPKEYLGK